MFDTVNTEEPVLERSYKLKKLCHAYIDKVKSYSARHGHRNRIRLDFLEVGLQARLAGFDRDDIPKIMYEHVGGMHPFWVNKSKNELYPFIPLKIEEVREGIFKEPFASKAQEDHNKTLERVKKSLAKQAKMISEITVSSDDESIPF